MQFYRSLRITALAFLLNGCLLSMPLKPQTSLCSFDNSSVDDKSNISPNFKCINDKQTRYKVAWNSKSADKMVSMPYKDYIKINAYYKKIFDIMERELMKKTKR